MYKLIWTTIWGTLGLFRHYRGVHYVYLSTIKGCIIAIRGYCTPQKRPNENTGYLCSKWDEERKMQNPDEFADLEEQHKTTCTANYKWTSQAMETSAALNIWKRSIAGYYTGLELNTPKHS